MADYSSFLADLRARRAALDEERAELDNVIRGIERLVSRSNGAVPDVQGFPQPRGGKRPPHGSLADLTMPEALKSYFSSLAPPQLQTTREVQDGIKAGGVKGGKNMRGHVYNTLHRLSQNDGPFVHHPDGRWGLREWGSSVGESASNRHTDLLQAVSR